MIRLNFSVLLLIGTTLSSCWIGKLELISNTAYAIGTVDYYNPVEELV